MYLYIDLLVFVCTHAHIFIDMSLYRDKSKALKAEVDDFKTARVDGSD